MRVIHDFQLFQSPSLGWGDEEAGDGTVELDAGRKALVGFNVGPINTHGSYRNIPFPSADQRIWQVDLIIPSSVSRIIALATLHGDQGLQSSGGAAIVFNTEVSPEIVFNDSDENPVAGGTPVNSLIPGETYTLKFRVNVDGTITAFLSGPSLDNHELGTTSLFSLILGADTYFGLQHTFIRPTDDRSLWDNFFVHNEGLSADLEDFMSYADIDDVKAEFPSLTFSSSTDDGVTQAEVTEWLDRYSARIDGQIANRYKVPVTTGDEALKILKEIAVGLVAAKIKERIFIVTGGQATSQREAAQAYRDEAKEHLKLIRKGEMKLRGAPSANVPTSESHGRVAKMTSNGFIAKFRKDDKQW